MALPLSGLSLSLFIFLLAWFTLPWIGVLESSRYAMIGILWLLMTLLFEISFGRLVAGRTWTELLGAYNFMTGNLWDLVLLSTALSPYLAAKLRGYA